MGKLKTIKTNWFKNRANSSDNAGHGDNGDHKEGREENGKENKGFFGVFLLLVIAFTTFFMITGFIQGIFQQITCNQTGRIWTDATPERYIMRYFQEEKYPELAGEEVYMFGSCRPRQ